MCFIKTHVPNVSWVVQFVVYDFYSENLGLESRLWHCSKLSTFLYWSRSNQDLKYRMFRVQIFYLHVHVACKKSAFVSFVANFPQNNWKTFLDAVKVKSRKEQDSFSVDESQTDTYPSILYSRNLFNSVHITVFSKSVKSCDHDARCDLPLRCLLQNW